MRAAALLLVVACRADPGEPEYPVFPPWDEVDADFLPGPFPYVEGDERLSFAVYYEGGASEVVEIDDATTHFYIYESTFTQATSEERIEGHFSDVITVSGAQLWWGGGVTWDNPTDLSEWTTLHASFRTTDALFADMVVAIAGGAEGRRKPSDYGFAADGEWHSVVIPLSAFTGVNFGAVTTAFSLVADAGTPDAELFVDDVYLTKE